MNVIHEPIKHELKKKTLYEQTKDKNMLKIMQESII
jgi:hypothetical protein